MNLQKACFPHTPVPSVLEKLQREKRKNHQKAEL
jgi:hypothetical protein